MSFYDSDILIRNIRKLMEVHGETQNDLAAALGMSQPNVSKALNKDDKKLFTLDQVVGIARHYNTSVDNLVGNYCGKRASTSPRVIAEFLVKVIEDRRALFAEVQINELVFEKDPANPHAEAERKDRQNTYLTIYLPDYWPIDEGVDTPVEDEIWMNYIQDGNETEMIPVNAFLHHFKEIFDVYYHGGISEDTYRAVVDDLLNHLGD